MKRNELPRTDLFIKDFLRSIKCPIIDPKKSDLCESGSKYLKDFSVMTAKFSHIIGLNRSTNTVINHNENRSNRRVSSASTDGSRKRKSQDSGSGDSNGRGGGGGKHPLWKTNPYKENIEEKLYLEKLYNRFSPEQKKTALV